MLVESILLPCRAPRVHSNSGDTALENLVLRQQLTVLKRKHSRPKLERLDRIFWITLRCCWSRWTEALIVKPETVVGWWPALAETAVGDDLDSRRVAALPTRQTAEYSPSRDASGKAPHRNG